MNKTTLKKATTLLAQNPTRVFLLVYAFLFGIGKIVFGEALIGLLYLGIAALSGFLIYRHFTRTGWETLVD